MLRSHKQTHHNFDLYLQQQLARFSWTKHLKVTRELYLLFFFGFLFFILFLRLFFLQIVDHSYYEDMLNTQHVSQSLLKAKRGNIFAYDKSGNPVQLTENITLYNVVVDPKLIWNKARFIEVFIPIVYQHLCEINGMKQIDKMGCIQNIGQYTQKKLLPVKPEIFYLGNGRISSGYATFDWTGYNNQIASVVSGFTKETAYGLISSKLQDLIHIGFKDKNYLGFFPNQAFLDELTNLHLASIVVDNQYYLSIIPGATQDIEPLTKLFTKYGYLQSYPNLDRYYQKQESRYVKLLADANPLIAQSVKDLKNTYYQERSPDKIPLLHSLALETYTKRYYEYGSFLSNILGYVDKNGNAFYGIEQYFDAMLRGKDGKIIGRSSSWIGNVGANDFQIDDVIDGNDIYLSIDIGIQKEIELLVKKYQESLKADSVSVLVLDPFDGSIKASANYPSFNSNDYNDSFDKVPLGVENAMLIDDPTYMDLSVYMYTGGTFRVAKTFERLDPNIPKYITKNIYGSTVFVDRNIAMPYEPGSIFKAFTVGIGIDLDEITLYDFYNDTNEAKVGPYTIKNADKQLCYGYNSFLHALVYSCNVGMVKIANGDSGGTGKMFGIGKESFYNYLDKLGFGRLTNVELANESEGFVEGVSTVSVARFLNNTFGQGLLTTPLQIVAGYAPILNGGYYLQPTIIKGILDKKTNVYTPRQKKVLSQIFRPETSEVLKYALFNVLDQNKELSSAKVEGYKLGGKSGTSQISFKGKYQQGIGWTNASFVGIITKDNPRYVVIVQVRRPRSSIRGSATAAKIFGDVAKFLINYSLIVN